MNIVPFEKTRVARSLHGKNEQLLNEYPIGNQNLSVAKVTISGRYPHEGKLVSIPYKMTAYVIEGSGSIVIDDQHQKFSKNDLVTLSHGEIHYWESELGTTLLMISQPKFIG